MSLTICNCSKCKKEIVVVALDLSGLNRKEKMQAFDNQRAFQFNSGYLCRTCYLKSNEITACYDCYQLFSSDSPCSCGLEEEDTTDTLGPRDLDWLNETMNAIFGQDEETRLLPISTFASVDT